MKIELNNVYYCKTKEQVEQFITDAIIEGYTWASKQLITSNYTKITSRSDNLYFYTGDHSKTITFGIVAPKNAIPYINTTKEINIKIFDKVEILDGKAGGISTDSFLNGTDINLLVGKINLDLLFSVMKSEEIITGSTGLVICTILQLALVVVLINNKICIIAFDNIKVI